MQKKKIKGCDFPEYN